MSAYFASVELYGRELTIKSAQCPAGRSVRGYIQPVNARALPGSRPAPPGRTEEAEYLLIAGPSAIVPGETELTVAAGGRVYRVLRAEPIYLGPSLGHWEGALRLKGGA